MTHTEFVDQLNRDGGYTTPADFKPRLDDRLFGWLDIHFYRRLLGVCMSCRKLLSRDFSLDNWKLESYKVFRAVEGCRGKVRVSGINNLDRDDAPYVYVSNHMSLIETFLLPVLMLDTSNIAIILKESLMQYPVFGDLLRTLNPIVVSRKNPKEDLVTVLKMGRKALQEEKRSILVFPQSTRTSDFDPSDFNTMGLKLAERNKVKVVPVALKTDFLKPGKMVRDFGKIDRSQPICFRFGTPMEVTKENSREVHEKCVEFIGSSLKEFNAGSQ